MDIYLRGMCDRSMPNGTELAREIQLKLIGQQQTNLSNWSSEVQILHDICTRLKHYLYSAKCSWIIKSGSHYARLKRSIYFAIKVRFRDISYTFCTYTCSCARTDDAKIANAQCKARESS